LQFRKHMAHNIGNYRKDAKGNLNELKWSVVGNIWLWIRKFEGNRSNLKGSCPNGSVPFLFGLRLLFIYGMEIRSRIENFYVILEYDAFMRRCKKAFHEGNAIHVNNLLGLSKVYLFDSPSEVSW
jgi:hypothetical protein